MPIIKSARKRVKVAAKANVRNTQTKRNLREALKAFAKAVSGGKAAEVAEAQKKAVSAIDTAVKKNVVHTNKGARQKAKLAAQAKAAGVKPAKKAAVSVKKPSAKKPAPKPKKPAAKKPAGKK